MHFEAAYGRWPTLRWIPAVVSSSSLKLLLAGCLNLGISIGYNGMKFKFREQLGVDHKLHKNSAFQYFDPTPAPQLACGLPMVHHHLAAFENQFQLTQMVNVI